MREQTQKVLPVPLRPSTVDIPVASTISRSRSVRRSGGVQPSQTSGTCAAATSKMRSGVLPSGSSSTSSGTALGRSTAPAPTSGTRMRAYDASILLMLVDTLSWWLMLQTNTALVGARWVSKVHSTRMPLSSLVSNTVTVDVPRSALAIA